MLRIRLSRYGGKKDPHYRVVVTEKSSPRDGRFVEIVGYYNPALEPVRLNLDLERVDYWLQNGAQPSETVQSLIKRVRAPQQKEAASTAPSDTDKENAEEEPTETVEQEA